VRLLWRSPQPPVIEEVLPPALLARLSDADMVLAEVLAEDITQRNRRGLPCGLQTYLAYWPTLSQSGPARRAVLVGEFIERSRLDPAGGVERVRTELHTRYPDMKADIDAVATIAMVVDGDDLLDASRHGLGTRLGKYRLDALLGAGTFAHTWLAWDDELRRHVALKLLRGSDAGGTGRAEDLEARVLAEAAAAAGLDHPAIVRVHEAGHIDGVGYIDAQFIGSIGTPADNDPSVEPGGVQAVSQTAETLVRAGTTAPERAARLISVIAGAVAAAHARGITHRDIKPANILMTPAGEPLLADFGLAAIETVDDQKSGAQGDTIRPGALETQVLRAPGRRIAGTPAYLAPEVARGEAATPLSDVFALGCTLRALLTGMPPRAELVVAGDGMPMADLLARIGSDPLAPLAATHSAIPITLARIVDRATAHEPAARYTSADRLAADLRAFLEHLPVEADPRGPVHLVRLWTRRHRTGVLIAGSLLVLACVVTFAFVSRIADERNRARLAERLAEARRDEAVSAEQTILQMNRFVSRMFNSSRGQQASAEFTVIEAIRLGASRVERTFADRPLAAAAVQHFLGQAASSSADFDTARAQLSAALQTRRKLLGPSHPDTIATLRQWAEMLNVSGQKAEAANICAEIVQTLGEDAALTNADGLFALAYVGGTTMNRRDFTEARRILERVALAHASRPSDGSADHSGTLNMLVTLNLSTGEFQKAEQTQRQIIQLNTALLGEDDISTLNSRQALGFVLREGGKRDQARDAYRDAIARYARVVGESHGYTINSRLELALTALPDDPVAAMEQVDIVEPLVLSLAPKQQNRLKFGWVRGQVLIAAGRLEEAAVGLQQAFENALDAMGPKDGWTKRTATLLADTLEKLGRKPEAAAVRAKLAAVSTPPAPTPPGDSSDAD
jgi:eukaryotic-like serine/threonine-protein kinase